LPCVILKILFRMKVKITITKDIAIAAVINAACRVTSKKQFLNTVQHYIFTYGYLYYTQNTPTNFDEHYYRAIEIVNKYFKQ